jgi:hypothetical protein
MSLQAFLSSPSSSSLGERVDLSSAILFMRYVKQFPPMLPNRRSFIRNTVFVPIRACEPLPLGSWDSGLQDSPLTSSRTREIQIDRQKGRITNRSTGKGFDVREWCSIIYVDPAGTIVSWSDSRELRQRHWMCDDVHHCGRHRGEYTLFLRIVSGACQLWESKWIQTLNAIDVLVSVKVSNSINMIYLLKLHVLCNPD